jgi:hypothetical protein
MQQECRGSKRSLDAVHGLQEIAIHRIPALRPESGLLCNARDLVPYRRNFLPGGSFFFMALSSQELEPPQNTGRFIAYLWPDL